MQDHIVGLRGHSSTKSAAVTTRGNAYLILLEMSIHAGSAYESDYRGREKLIDWIQQLVTRRLTHCSMETQSIIGHLHRCTRK